MKISRKQAREMGIAPEKKQPTKTPRKGVGKAAFLAMCASHGLPEPVAEYPFHPTRKWAFDWLFDGWLALEIEGGVWIGGRHTSGQGFLGDMEKYNEAVILGYTVVRCTPEQVKSGEAFALVKRVLDSLEV